MSELENIENVEEVETIPTDNTTKELQENVEQSTSNNELAEQERLQRELKLREQREQEEREREEAEEQARLQAIQEHEEYLNSFPETTVFYDRIIETDTYKCLGSWTKSAHTADSLGFLDNHMDESELTFVPNNKELTSGIYYIKGHEKPESTIEELKAKKLAEISAEAHKYSQYECGEMYLTSSVGFKINADHKSQDNIRGLIALNTATAFKDFDNQFHQVSVNDLNTMLTECYVNGSSLYQQKFEYESRVDAAKSAEDLYFDVTFSMADFSAK